MEKIKVKDINKNSIGILSYSEQTDSFCFEYADDFTGYSFGELDCNKGRKFSSDALFSLFFFPDSFHRDKMVKKYNIQEPDSNKFQWFLLNLWTENPTKSFGGFYYERVEAI